MAREDYEVGDLVQWSAFADESLFGIISEVEIVAHNEGAWTYARTRFKVDWFEENHIESLVKAIGNNDYAYSLRKLINHDGSFWDYDNFESIGHHGNFIDLNCYLMKKTLATKIAPLWFNTTGELMIGDRFIFHELKQNNISWAATGEYTVNYRLNPNRDLKNFFENGNMKNKLIYPQGFPWQLK
jgi:hypothetical protein